MRTRDLDEAIDAVTKVYCPHTVQVIGPGREVDVVLEVTRPTSQPLVELSYGVPVDIDAGNFPHLFLMMHCADGGASTTQGNQSAEWYRGQTLPFSAGLETRLRFDRAFVQKSVRLNAEGLEALCSRWLGHPLRQPLRFALRHDVNIALKLVSRNKRSICSRLFSQPSCQGAKPPARSVALARYGRAVLRASRITHICTLVSI